MISQSHYKIWSMRWWSRICHPNRKRVTSDITILMCTYIYCWWCLSVFLVLSYCLCFRLWACCFLYYSSPFTFGRLAKWGVYSDSDGGVHLSFLPSYLPSFQLNHLLYLTTPSPLNGIEWNFHRYHFIFPFCTSYFRFWSESI